MLHKCKQGPYLESTVTAAKNTPSLRDLIIRSIRRPSDSL